MFFRFFICIPVAAQHQEMMESVHQLTGISDIEEMDPDEMAETVMSAETRTLKQITMEDVETVAKTFMSLMGEAVDPRKKFIEKNSWRANIDV